MFCVERVPAEVAYKYKLKFWALDGALNACWGGKIAGWWKKHKFDIIEFSSNFTTIPTSIMLVYFIF